MPFMGHTKPAELSSAVSTYLCLVSHINKSQQPKGDSGVALPDQEPGVFCEPNVASHDDSQFGDKVAEHIQWPCIPSAQGGWDDVLEGRGTNDSSNCAVPPPGFVCFGVRKVANDLQQQAKPASTTDEYTPAPELEYLRLIGQLGYKEPLPDDLESLLFEVLASQAARATKSPDVMGTRRSVRKKLKMESKIDCVAAPYETTTYEEPDD
ncbi:hypothetical protein DL765_008902 [Monosporascus sp. GIB2]|nr:hypothetical protein DL765_008902 [Monosporascus sp. GIB2]